MILVLYVSVWPPLICLSLLTHFVVVWKKVGFGFVRTFSADMVV